MQTKHGLNSIVDELCEAILQHISRWLDILPKIVGQVGWRQYLKRVHVRIKRENAKEISLKPDIWYYPSINPFLRLKLGNKWVNLGELFNIAEDIIRILNEKDILISWKPNVRKVTSELIFIALESKIMQLPSKSEISNRIVNNTELFIKRAIRKENKFKSVAPVVPCNLARSVQLGDCVFRNPTKEDISVIAMATNFSESTFFTTQFPVLALEHEVDWVPNSLRFSIEDSLRHLHNSFKRRTHEVLLAIRLSNPDPIGFGVVYHIDAEWSTPMSMRLTTEEPNPMYKPYTTIGFKPISRASLILPEKVDIDGKNVQVIYEKTKAIRHAVIENPNNVISHISMALDYYNKSLDEYDNNWALLDLVNALEAICRFESRRRNPCVSNGRIIRVFSEYDQSPMPSTEKKIIKDAYRRRSEFIAHSFTPPLDVDMKILKDVRDLTRKRLLRHLDD